MPAKSTAQQIVDNLVGIDHELTPIVNKLFEHPSPDFTVEEKYMLRNRLIAMHAQIQLMYVEVAEIDAERNRRFSIRNPFKK